MRFIITVIFFLWVQLNLGQRIDRLSPITSGDVGLISAAITHTPVISNSILTDLSFGIGPGFDVAEGSHLVRLLPAAFIALTPKVLLKCK
jgi:hypothetical protein